MSAKCLFQSIDTELGVWGVPLDEYSKLSSRSINLKHRYITAFNVFCYTWKSYLPSEYIYSRNIETSTTNYKIIYKKFQIMNYKLYTVEYNYQYSTIIYCV